MSVTENGKDKEGGVYETVKVIIQALLIALVVRTFLFQPFNIPSGSMKDTLLIGDYLFVSKFSYGYSAIPSRLVWRRFPAASGMRNRSAAISRFSNCRQTLLLIISSGSLACRATPFR
jgi:signal peptidase I